MDHGHVTRPIRGKFVVQFVVPLAVVAVVSRRSVAPIPCPTLHPQKRYISGNCLHVSRRRFYDLPAGQFCIVPILTSPACLVLRLACLLVSSSKLARRWSARQFDRLLIQDELERGVRRGGSRSKLVRSCLCGCWRGHVCNRVGKNGHLVRRPHYFLLYMKMVHKPDRLLSCTVSSVWFFSVRPFYDTSFPVF